MSKTYQTPAEMAEIIVAVVETAGLSDNARVWRENIAAALHQYAQQAILQERARCAYLARHRFDNHPPGSAAADLCRATGLLIAETIEKGLVDERD